jgi:F-type H+-transporting ATPase subunit epsilon
MIAALEEGVIRYQTDEKKEQEIKIQSGFVEIKDDILSVCIE